MDLLIIVLIILAGPVLGSLAGVIKLPSKGFLYHMLAFSAGIMLAISFFSLIPESLHKSSVYLCIGGVLLGAVAMHFAGHALKHFHIELCSTEDEMKKTSIFLFLAVFIHNFPEGMAIALGTVSDFRLTVGIALAIAIHDIPESLCTSVPIYYCTKKRLESFLISVSTAVPTIIGFITAYFLFGNIPAMILGLIVGMVAGIMIYISADELIPSSCCRITNHNTIFSFMSGVIAVLALTSFF